MANPNAPHGFIAEFTFHGTAIPMWQGTVKSAQAFSVGDPITATGGLIIRHSGSTTLASNRRGVVGISYEAKTAAATVRDTLLFVPALDTIVFSGQFGSVTVFSQGDVFTRARIVGTGKGVMRLTSGTPSFGHAVIIGLKKTSSFGQYGEAMFIWGKSLFTGKNSLTWAIN